MRADVRTPGSLLGEIIAEDRGAGLVGRIEEIRALAKRARQSMDEMAALALHSYREMIGETAAFVPMFQALTPESELSELALGSRPSRRKPSTGINSLRPIRSRFATHTWIRCTSFRPGCCTACGKRATGGRQSPAR